MFQISTRKGELLLKKLVMLSVTIVYLIKQISCQCLSFRHCKTSAKQDQVLTGAPFVLIHSVKSIGVLDDNKTITIETLI